MSTVIYTTAEGDMLDMICLKYYGHAQNQIVEQVLTANQGLADKGSVYQAGLEILLPDIDVKSQTETVRLWTE
jgi:phage tail protein X